MSKQKNQESQVLVGEVHDYDVVQKSRPLLSIWDSELTLQEFKLLDAYLSQINSHNPDRRRVRIEKGDLERIFGVKKINQSILEERLRNLLGRTVKLTDPKKDRGFSIITLFEIASCEKDDDGLWQIDLECTRSAMEYCFNMERFGYLKYRVHSIAAIKSRHTYVLFQYLLYCQFRKTWTVSLDELKRILQCDTQDIYKEYKYFNDNILKKGHKELSENVGYEFTYEPIRRARRVVAIRFTVKGKADDLSAISAEDITTSYIETPKTASKEPAKKEYTYSNENIEFLADACKGEFSEIEMNVIFDALVSALPYKKSAKGLALERYEMLQRCYDKLLVRAARTDLGRLTNRLSYLISIIKSESAGNDI